MKIKVTVLFMIIVMLFSTTASADLTDKSYVEVPKSNISIKYLDFDGLEKTVSLEDKTYGVNAHPFISIESISKLNYVAEKFVFLLSYTKYDEYIMLNSPGKFKIAMYIDDKNYTIMDSNWKDIGKGIFSEAPFVEDDVVYIPLEAILALGHNFTVENNNIFIDTTKVDTTIFPVVDNDEKLETNKNTNANTKEKKLANNEFKVVDAYEKTKYEESHGLGDTIVTERKIILEQNGKTIDVDFLDPNLPELMKDMASLTIKTAEQKLIGKTIQLKITPKNNYEFVLYIMNYMLNMK